MTDRKPKPEPMEPWRLKILRDPKTWSSGLGLPPRFAELLRAHDFHVARADDLAKRVTVLEREAALRVETQQYLDSMN